MGKTGCGGAECPRLANRPCERMRPRIAANAFADARVPTYESGSLGVLLPMTSVDAGAGLVAGEPLVAALSVL